MRTELTDTTASKINRALLEARRAIGSPTMGLVLTLVVATDEENAYDAVRAASEASREHPCRIIAVIKRTSRGPHKLRATRLDAELRVGSDAGHGEVLMLRLHGELTGQAGSVVLPLLLPDAPAVAWWPAEAPADPGRDSLGALAQRRITDAQAAVDPVGELDVRAGSYRPGDTDLAWTRLTPWRALLAAALDQKPLPVTGATVESEADNPSAELLARWLEDRLDVPVTRVESEGPVITRVALQTTGGEIRVERPGGSLATLSLPGSPDRRVALKIRSGAELIAEELRRLDADEVYGSALRHRPPQAAPSA
ncbi:glucose-6-phosphate dehydrogenase assembly protein OpcA [Streptomyces subrutilus]|uniref:Glucose-6-phosphate dehydrogenase assembly protein OpcA n=1 Tax=Streptomyces subrutilus TaxID=36818 RepID=A0A5P2UT91_9ACTN|nr:glucose-6-phosphate dehydrogenase assembly protein OpcA [Streptomyces subrutilus]QEU79927.1 glucose-6-phosphate dehydrogenase assembly protein OpcA [Streptomyces subrutilus]WSJ30811.1 glucose-6-phosphate dehydrogenase assembly protein OpcA [Streptomyces subrutilus]GGZ90921.1 glucose-6-phosphate dehydrogenase assembly protein OpcA [Streptomyces subrutilus]